MKTIPIGAEVAKARRDFFIQLFGKSQGYLAVAARRKSHFEEQFFMYPNNLDAALEWINRNYHGKNLYFCPQLFSSKKRVKETVSVCTCIWADLDECDPNQLSPLPSIVLLTSPGRYQGLWLLDTPAEPADAEDAAHRIAYKYESAGVDKTGWDLTQLLRIPFTYNNKYGVAADEVPVVEIIRATNIKFPLAEFLTITAVPGTEYTEIEMPPGLEDRDPQEVFERHRLRMDDRLIELFETEPEGDWSTSLWNLEMLCLESGLTKEETFTVCHHAKCNKFLRDGHSPRLLWKDVCRAESKLFHQHPDVGISELEPLLTESERASIYTDSFVDRYLDWARSRGDAAWQYHEAGAFTILSALLSGVIKLQTSYGAIVPNLWFMILADTTLTRKSTAMDMAMDLLLATDEDAILATDGSLEGLMTAISTRPGRPGIFWRDEFSGLLDSMQKKDYMAGMIETLTNLYDGKYQKRILRKEVIELKDPILILFCGGIKSRILELLSPEHIISGFIPRFLFVSAESDLTQYQSMGPATSVLDERKGILQKEVQKLKATYTSEQHIKIGDQSISTPKSWNVELTSEAWERFNKFEHIMVQAGTESNNPEMFTPVFTRLYQSGLKMAMLLAAIRQTPEAGVITVTKADILKMISYIERWREFTVDVVQNAGKTVTEKKLQLLLKAIRRSPNGTPRSILMQHYHLTSRDADWIFETLDQRGLIRRIKVGRAQRVFPIV